MLASRYPALRFEYLTAADLRSSPDLQRAGQDSDRARFARTATPHQDISRTRFGNQLRAKIAEGGFDVVLSGGAGNFGLTWHGADLLPYLARKGRLPALLREAYATARQRQCSSVRILLHELVLPALPAVSRRWGKRVRNPDPFALYGDTPLRREVVSELDLEGAWEEDGFDPYFAWLANGPAQRAKWLFDRPLLQHDNFPRRRPFRTSSCATRSAIATFWNSR